MTDPFQLLETLPLITKRNLVLALDLQPDNLNFWLKQRVKKGELIRLKPGYYISPRFLTLTAQSPQEHRHYFEYLANQLRTPSYLSREYRLAELGFIPEAVMEYTSVTSKSTRLFETKLANFSYRSIRPELFAGIETIKWGQRRLLRAQPGKALFDYFYFQSDRSPQAWSQLIIERGRFNWSVFTPTDWTVFASFVAQAHSSKMTAIGQVLKQARLL